MRLNQFFMTLICLQVIANQKSLIKDQDVGFQHEYDFCIKYPRNWQHKKSDDFGCFWNALEHVYFLTDMSAFAETSQTTEIKLDDERSLQRTITVMSIPENNAMPWGTIKGKVHDPVQGYPVIIQFFKSLEEDPIHVAQVKLKGDNSFEYSSEYYQ